MFELYNNDCLDILPKLNDLSVDLCICDPPYFKTVNHSWDYQWKTEEDYIEWVAQWANLLSEKMRYGGSFYLFGYFRTLCKLVPLFEDLGFGLRQQIILDKGIKAVAGRATKKYKMFPNVTESCLFFVKDPHKKTQSILLQAKESKKLTATEINEALGVKSNGGGMWSIYTGKNICKQVPTKELWNKLKDILDIDIAYESLAQTYNPIMGLTDVWSDLDFYEKTRYHPTQKPYKLIERLILASSNENDLVLDPFMGGGVSAVVCKSLSRRFIGIEKDEMYYNTVLSRMQNNQLSLQVY
jgi:adenine-specific DNA-methyltransferase